MIHLNNTRIAALSVTAALAVGAASVPAAALARSHPATTAGERSDRQSPDKPGVKDTRSTEPAESSKSSDGSGSGSPDTAGSQSPDSAGQH